MKFQFFPPFEFINKFLLFKILFKDFFSKKFFLDTLANEITLLMEREKNIFLRYKQLIFLDLSFISILQKFNYLQLK